MNIAVLAICVILLRVGQMLFEASISRSKNAASAVMRALCSLAVCALAFWAVGGAIFFQNQNGVIGLDYHLLFSDDSRVATYVLFALVATGQVSSTLGERTRFAVTPILSAFVAVIVVPIVGQWTWRAGGFLNRVGVYDLGGALPLGLACATVALVAAAYVGPRGGKYNHDGSANAIPGHNVAMMGGGMMLILAGWLGYLMLATLRITDWAIPAVFNGILAASAGAVAGMVFSAVRYGKVEVLLTMLGMLGGLASAMCGLGMPHAWAAVLIGAAAGAVACWATVWIDIRWHIDDASGMSSAIACGTLVSLIGSPLLAARGPEWTARFRSLGANMLAAAITITFCALLTWGLLKLVSRFMRIRVSEADEYDGLDLAEHDVNAYPDFQQTMIKSYHLREA